MKDKKYATGIRCLREFNIDAGKDVNRIDLLLCKILTENAETVSANPERQFSFSVHPDSVTPSQIAKCLRSLAYKIQHTKG